ncbi:MAG TPA: FtsW/RodA/SpoVE family cell cycle protein, partial [Tepidisphaeraceae bacterium]|nr:FtsW/RodA/SpoVE family cell cycle protein [Tepidisphaeraceae bacterium]
MSLLLQRSIRRRSFRMRDSHIWRRLAIATNWPIIASVLVLCAVGLITIRGFGLARGDLGDAKKQLIFFGIGVGCMLAFQIVNYQKIGRFAWAFYLLSFIPLGYTVLGTMYQLPGVNRINGACNWIRLGPFSLQPAELMKVAFVMVLARYLRFRKNYRSISGLLAPFALCIAPVILILKQPDLGTALVFGPTLLAMLFVAGAKMKHMLTILGLGLLMVPIVWMSGQPNVPILGSLPSLMSDYQ